jgi:hypothetical protein
MPGRLTKKANIKFECKSNKKVLGGIIQSEIKVLNYILSRFEELNHFGSVKTIILSLLSLTADLRTIGCLFRFSNRYISAHMAILTLKNEILLWQSPPELIKFDI